VKRLPLPFLAVILVSAVPLAFAVETNSIDAASTNAPASVSTNLTVIVDGVKYEHVRFEVANPVSVKIWHSTGIAVVPMEKLPKEFQKQLGYDAEKAAEWQASQRELQVAQQRKRAEEEAAKREAELQEHTLSIKALEASLDSIPNGTVIVTFAFTDGHMSSESDPAARGFSNFSLNDEHDNTFYKATCQTAGKVFGELLNVKGNQPFEMIGYKTAYGNVDFPYSVFVVTEVHRLDAEAWYGLAEAYEAAGKTDEAITLYHFAIQLKPVYPKAFLGLSEAWEKAGRTDKALSVLRQAVKIRPDYAEGWCRLGTIYNRSGLTEEAVSAFREALKLKPDDAQIWLSLGAAYQQAGKTNEADSAIQRAKGLNAELSK
jgi:tetratricopeptide (TPR) repeat protein